ncbi:hypothetical protein [Azotosporobacter soli]|uniref:hypothetical protein n=1 Tax=Azotosporobacter soli TaxID=3055040 RepID=UPI0031FEACF7
MKFSQPTVTTQIRTLEEDFGVLLFEQGGKKRYRKSPGVFLYFSNGRPLEVQEIASASQIGNGLARLAELFSNLAKSLRHKKLPLRIAQGKLFGVEINKR